MQKRQPELVLEMAERVPLWERLRKDLCRPREGGREADHTFHSATAPPVIGRVPERLRALDPGAFEPLVVSIGPYHHGRNPNLKRMEAHKHRALLTFLDRTKVDPEDAFQAVLMVAPQLMDSYAELEEQWRDGDRFVELVVYDGCFVLEVMHAANAEGSSGYAYDDSVFGLGGKRPVMRLIKRDMLLLENQLPMLALTILAGIANQSIGINSNKVSDTYVNDLIRKFYSLPLDIYQRTENIHILDKYWLCRTWEGQDFSVSLEEIGLSAKELSDGGVQLKVSKSDNFSAMKLSFTTVANVAINAVLMIPSLYINEDTKTKLLNLVAYEGLQIIANKPVLMHIWFLNGLLERTEDVKLLRRRRIIRGWEGRDMEVLRFFHELATTADENITFTETKSGLLYDLYSYRLRWFSRLRANFVMAFPKNPWVSGWGTFLLGLTLLQSVYAVLQLYVNK